MEKKRDRELMVVAGRSVANYAAFGEKPPDSHVLFKCDGCGDVIALSPEGAAKASGRDVSVVCSKCMYRLVDANPANRKVTTTEFGKTQKALVNFMKDKGL